MNSPICKACGVKNHPYYDRKYHGYCLQCSNAGAPEKDEEIARLRTLLRKARMHLDRTSVADEINQYFEEKRDDL